MQRAIGITKQRCDTDRRLFNWRTVACGFFLSRRRSERRSTEVEPIFTDWHHPWLFFLAIGTMLLSSLDAFMTLQLLARGAYEANPFMAALIGHSTMAFAATKMLLTATGILALVFLSRARFMNRIRTGTFLTAFFTFYCCLACYEFVQLMWLI
jgi:hypothetical protein